MVRRSKNLWRRVIDFQSLCEATRRAAQGKALSQAAVRFLVDLEPEIFKLQRSLVDGSYHPKPYQTFRIVDPKPRIISAASFPDRVVHHSLCAAMAPTFERLAIEDSFACMPRKGTQRAVKRGQAFCRGHPWALNLDIARFFETAKHEILSQLLCKYFAERKLLNLCDRFIFMGAPGSLPGEGLPIGNLTSQHFANLYLMPLDRFIKQKLRVSGYLRYMDDLLLFGPDKATLKAWKLEIEAFAQERLQLKLREKAERLNPTRIGVAFLGFRIWPRLIRLDGARRRRVIRRLHRLSGLEEEAVLPQMESLFAWLEQADTLQFRRSLLRRLARDGAPRYFELGES